MAELCCFVKCGCAIVVIAHELYGKNMLQCLLLGWFRTVLAFDLGVLSQRNSSFDGPER